MGGIILAGHLSPRTTAILLKENSMIINPVPTHPIGVQPGNVAEVTGRVSKAPVSDPLHETPVGVLGIVDVGDSVLGARGVLGTTTNGFGFLAGTDPVFGEHAGVFGTSDAQGVMGIATTDTGTGVYGNSKGGGFGVRGETVTGTGVQGQSFGSGLAGRFVGNVEVTGDVVLRGAGDCAEQFHVQEDVLVEPGAVMVLDEDETLRLCDRGYDRKVAGVISGAGDFRPGLILAGYKDAGNSSHASMPLALVGRVHCKVDAEYGPVEAGDLLTSSPTIGHAMKAADPVQSFGAVIGKALRPLKSGRGLVPILVALQ
jgi:hypothetical protein